MHSPAPRFPFLVHSLWFVLLAAFATSAAGAGHQPTAIEREAQIGEGIALFVPTGYKPIKTPSLALVQPPQERGPLPADWKLVPEFFLDDGNAGASLDVPAGSSLYGTGEVTGPLLRNGQKITLWNTDNYAYHKADGKRLYQSHPWVLGVRPDGSAFGVLFDTTWRAELQTGSDRITFQSAGAPFRVIVIDRASPQAVVRGLAELTGKMPMPPAWALGFHQCRYSYYPDARVREIADTFRAKKIPCDVIWMDIDYMNGFRVFTFDPKRFPDPKSTNDYLHKNAFHSVWMIDPGVKVDHTYPVYASGAEHDLFVHTKDGAEFHGKVWPGDCAFPDFTMPETRQWWAGQYTNYLATGIDGVWNDMNEPSVFDGPDGSMPEDTQHRGGGDLPPGSHELYHNVFGMLMVRSTREGMMKTRPEQRPFVLSRSNYLGGQRYAATWTGDNRAEMSYLRLSVPMSINLGLSGQPMSGPDIGGYEGGATPELFGQWIAVGAFYPFCRAHTSTSSPSQEPWAFGPEIENVSRTALERRYRLMPYLYTLAHNASETGDPIMQPVFFADPRDADLRTEERAFLFGPDLLVVPTWADAPKLPRGIWRDVSLLDGKREQDGYQPAIKVRGGAIIPLGRVVQSTNETSLDPLTLLVCLDERGEATGSLYEDAGDGYGYTKHESTLTHYRARRVGDAVEVSIGGRESNGTTGNRPIQVNVLTDDGVRTGSGGENTVIKMVLPPEASKTR